MQAKSHLDVSLVLTRTPIQVQESLEHPTIEVDSYALDWIELRAVRLAVLRELQVNRATDIVSLRRRLCANQKLSPLLVGALSVYRKTEAVEGEPSGIDPLNGYPYKRWRVVDEKSAKKAAMNCRLPLMPASGKDKIKPDEE
jgi:hypothetical protein